VGPLFSLDYTAVTLRTRSILPDMFGAIDPGRPLGTGEVQRGWCPISRVIATLCALSIRSHATRADTDVLTRTPLVG
jgi:hypothetical protein